MRHTEHVYHLRYNTVLTPESRDDNSHFTIYKVSSTEHLKKDMLFNS